VSSASAEADTVSSMVQDIVGTYKKHVHDGRRGAPSRETNASVEALVRHLLDTYPGEIAPGDVSAVLGAGASTLGSQAAIPLWVIRELLHTYHIAFDFNEVPSWEEFSNRYGDEILAA